MREDKEVKNEDALFKFLTYSGMIEKKRRENLQKIRKDPVVGFSIHNFDEYYKD